MKHLRWGLSLSLFLLLTNLASFAQTKLDIAIINDNSSKGNNQRDFELSLQNEIKSLIGNRYDINFHSEYPGMDFEGISAAFDVAFANPEIDLILSIGAVSSQILAQKEAFPKPSISGIILDPIIQNVPKTDTGTSGIRNYTYVQSPFDIIRDMNRLYEVKPYKNLTAIGGNSLSSFFPLLQKIMGDFAQSKGAKIHLQVFQGSVVETIDSLSAETDAVYVLPLFDLVTDDELKNFFHLLNEKNLPSSALLGEDYINAGALIGYEANPNLSRIPRRIAINIMKILEGEDAANLPVEIQTFSDKLIINMKTARETGIFPNFDLMADAMVINLNDVPTTRTLSLQGVIIEALQQNLDLNIAKYDPQIAEKEVQLAKAEYMPQANVSTSFSLIDDVTASSSFGVQGRLNWLASGDLSQLVYSEPALANIMIQELLMEGSKAGAKQTELDVVLDAATAYLQVLQSKQLVTIQQNNVSLTKDNYDIAKAKEQVGYSGVSDLYRWRSELAQANINLNDAQAQFRQAQFLMNQLLNRPIDEEFATEEIGIATSNIILTDERMTLVDNYGDLKKVADFMVSEAKQHLPALQQINLNISAQNRLAKSRKRAFYLPSVALSGGTSYIVDKWEVTPLSPEVASFGVGNVNNSPIWDIGLGFQFPITQGGKRSANWQQTKLEILQLEDTKQNLTNQFEFRVRSNMEIVGASYARVELSKESNDAAQKNFQLVQDSYSQGQVNITTLIDAQNAALQTRISAINAEYTFLVDFLSLERSIGFFYSLASPEEKEAFFYRMATFVTQ